MNKDTIIDRITWELSRMNLQGLLVSENITEALNEAYEAGALAMITEAPSIPIEQMHISTTAMQLFSIGHSIHSDAHQFEEDIKTCVQVARLIYNEAKIK